MSSFKHTSWSEISALVLPIWASVCLNLNLQPSKFWSTLPPGRNVSPQFGEARAWRKFAQVSGLLPDTNEQFVFPFLSKPSSEPSPLWSGEWEGAGSGGMEGWWGRLRDSVFVFKEFRLAYKCKYNTFKVKLINLLVSLLTSKIRRILKKDAKKCQRPPGEKTNKQSEVSCGVIKFDNV